MTLSHETTHDVCAATGKRIYISEAKAWLCAGRIQKKNKRNGDRHAVHSYHCDACGHYHVGHVTEGRRKTTRPRRDERELAA
jgi:hypothetical protein